MENKNSLIGSLLLAVLIVGMFWYSNKNAKPDKPTTTTQLATDTPVDAANTTTAAAANSTVASTPAAPQDSNARATSFGPFARAAAGSEQETVIETDLQRVTLSNKGGRIKRVELKQYKTWDKKPLILFDEKSQDFSYQFVIADNKIINTKDLYFEPSGTAFTIKGNEERSISMKLKAGDGQYFEQVYTFHGDNYQVGYKLNLQGMDKIMPNNNDLQVTWNSTLLNQEHSVETERRYSALYYKYSNADPAHLDEDKPAQQEAFTGRVDWVSYKQQFFNATLMSKGLLRGIVKADFAKEQINYVKKYNATLLLDYHAAPTASYDMQFYFGPNHYNTLGKVGVGLESIIKLSPDNMFFSWIKYITRWAIIPTFNILDSIHLNYGIIILILTLLLKLALTPLTWKAIKSAASMKILKPEIEGLKEKYGDDQQKISTEQMKIYQKAGVSPFGGCLPTLLQMPILLSMYYFFPTSIELRQQPFLWATDLSSYDAVMTFASPILGQNHISLFTVLMTITSILFAMYTQTQSGMANTQPGMQYMPYIMPVFLMFMFNSFPAALTYYYLLQNVISMAQQWLIQRFFIDEKALHQKIEDNKKKPSQKKGWMKKLEDLQKQAEVQQKQRKK
jgi:YidC/Oxa1 family membrane protein insertase